jgi:co-chaperonin GroES (HSP10)
MRLKKNEMLVREIEKGEDVKEVKVIAVGINKPGEEEDSLNLKKLKGKNIIISEDSGKKVMIKGERYILLKPDDIMAIVVEPEII